MKYSLIRNTLDTGDILLFKGKAFYSKIIRLIDQSDYTHAGMVYNNKQTGQLDILESTTLYKGTKGVQLNPLGQRLREYNGSVSLRRLHVERTQSFTDAINGWIRDNRRTSYEKGLAGLWELFKASVDFWPFINKPDPDEIFCTELIAIVYQLWGLIPQEYPANEITPRDLVGLNGLFEQLIIESGAAAYLGPVIEVK